MRFLSFLFLLRTVHSLRVTSGSPCENICGTTTNTTVDEVVCRDGQYSSPPGSQFKECVSCELQSTYNDQQSGESDAKWGLYNLRFTFSTCLYGFPVQKQSLSTPCQVSCDTLSNATQYDLLEPSGPTAYDFCGLGSFADNVVSTCSGCYSLTEDEKILANFIESIKQGCDAEVVGGDKFVVEPERIFTTVPILPLESALNPPTEDTPHKKNLVLIITLPILGFLIILGGLCVGCFFLVRHRRRKARKARESQMLEQWQSAGMMSPQAAELHRSWALQTPYHTDFNSVYGAPTGFQSPGYFYQQQDIKQPAEAYVMRTSEPPHGQSADTEQMNRGGPTVPILSAPPAHRKASSDVTRS